MDWNNTNLDNGHERDLNFLDPYSFETLLLEISCNIKTEDLTKETVLKHAFEQIERNAAEAKEILRNNIDNIINHELNNRKSK